MDTARLKRLHENLMKKDGFTVPYEQFEKDMRDEAKFRKLHESLTKKDGFNVPYEQFEKDMWGDEKPFETKINKVKNWLFEKEEKPVEPKKPSGFKIYSQDQADSMYQANMDAVGAPRRKMNRPDWKDEPVPEPEVPEERIQQPAEPQDIDIKGKISAIESEIQQQQAGQNWLEKAWDNPEEEKVTLAANMLRKAQDQKEAVTGTGGTGVGDALKDRNFWTLGAGDLASMVYLKKIANKIDRNEELTPSDIKLLDAYHTLSETQKMYPANKAKRGYQVGKQVTDMVPWLAQFALTKGAGGAVEKAFTNTLQKGIQKYLGKALGMTAGAYAASSLMPTTYTGIIERNLGDTKQEEGKIVFDKTTQDNLPTAIYKGWTSSALETLTESLGGVMGDQIGMLGKAIKWNPAEKYLGAAGKKVYNAFTGFTRALGWNGAPMEYLEEWINIPLNALLVGDSKYSDMFDKDQQLTTLLTVVAMGGAMSTTSTGLAYVADKYEQQRINKDYKQAANLFETQIDPQTKAKVNSIVNNANLGYEDVSKLLHGDLSKMSAEKAGIILNYIVRKTRADSANKADTEQRSFEYQGKNYVYNKSKDANGNKVIEEIDDKLQPTGNKISITPRDQFEIDRLRDLKEIQHDKTGEIVTIFNREDTDHLKPLYVKSGDTTDADGMLTVTDGTKDKNGNFVFKPIHVSKVADPVRADLYTALGMEMKAYDQQQNDIQMAAQAAMQAEQAKSNPAQWQEGMDVIYEGKDYNVVSEDKNNWIIAGQGTTLKVPKVTPVDVTKVTPETPAQPGSQPDTEPVQAGTEPVSNPDELEQPQAAPVQEAPKKPVPMTKDGFKDYDQMDPEQFYEHYSQDFSPEEAVDELTFRKNIIAKNIQKLTDKFTKSESSTERARLRQEVKNLNGKLSEIDKYIAGNAVNNSANVPENVNNIVNNIQNVSQNEGKETEGSGQPQQGTGTGVVSPEISPAPMPENGTEAVQELPVSSLPADQRELEQPLNIQGNEKQEVQAERQTEGNKEVNAAAAQAEVNPTDAQKEAGNYKKGHVKISGMDISIENPAGSTRSGTDAKGNKWENKMNHHYGYFTKTNGKDGDQIDTFINPDATAYDKVYAVDQNNPDTGEFDETKVMLGFKSPDEAKQAYLSNYNKEWTGFRSITEVPIAKFKKWLYDGARQRKPFAEYKEIKVNKKRAWPTPKAITEALKYEANTPKEIAMQYFISGGKINKEALQYVYGNKHGKSVEGERKAHISYYSKDGGTIDGIAHSLWEEQPVNDRFNSQDFTNAVIDVINSYNSPVAMAKDIPKMSI
jgi:hypothetical protein